LIDTIRYCKTAVIRFTYELELLKVHQIVKNDDGTQSRISKADIEDYQAGLNFLRDQAAGNMFQAMTLPVNPDFSP
jgi:hypothetical protein